MIAEQVVLKKKMAEKNIEPRKVPCLLFLSPSPSRFS